MVIQIVAVYFDCHGYKMFHRPSLLVSSFLRFVSVSKGSPFQITLFDLITAHTL